MRRAFAFRRHFFKRERDGEGGARFGAAVQRASQHFNPFAHAAQSIAFAVRSAASVVVNLETAGAVLWCDGRRMVELPPGARVEVARGTRPVLLARLRAGAGRAGAGQVGAPFTDRLVEKFGLPVAGWP